MVWQIFSVGAEGRSGGLCGDSKLQVEVADIGYDFSPFVLV